MHAIRTTEALFFFTLLLHLEPSGAWLNLEIKVKRKTAIIAPLKSTLLVGEPLEINCTLPSENPSHFNASDLHFKFSKPVPAMFHETLSSDTVRMWVPRMSAPWQGYVWCIRGNDHLTSTASYVTVVYAPERADNIKIIFTYAEGYRSNLNISWCMAQHNRQGVLTMTKLDYLNEHATWTSCQELNGSLSDDCNSCLWKNLSISTIPPVVNITVYNKELQLYNTTSFQPMERLKVKLPPLINASEASLESDSVLLIVAMPITHQLPQYTSLFRVTATSEEKKIKIVELNGTRVGGNTTTIHISGLEPYTTYQFHIQWRTAHSGVWSDPVLTTATTLPTAPPMIKEMHLSRLSNTSLLLTWEGPNKARGPLVGYLINQTSGTTTEITRVKANQQVIHLNCDQIKSASNISFTVSGINVYQGKELIGPPSPRKIYESCKISAGRGTNHLRVISIIPAVSIVVLAFIIVAVHIKRKCIWSLVKHVNDKLRIRMEIITPERYQIADEHRINTDGENGQGNASTSAAAQDRIDAGIITVSSEIWTDANSGSGCGQVQQVDDGRISPDPFDSSGSGYGQVQQVDNGRISPDPFDSSGSGYGQVQQVDNGRISPDPFDSSGSGYGQVQQVDDKRISPDPFDSGGAGYGQVQQVDNGRMSPDPFDSGGAGYGQVQQVDNGRISPDPFDSSGAGYGQVQQVDDKRISPDPFDSGGSGYGQVQQVDNGRMSPDPFDSGGAGYGQVQQVDNGRISPDPFDSSGAGNGQVQQFDDGRISPDPFDSGGSGYGQVQQIHNGRISPDSIYNGGLHYGQSQQESGYGQVELIEKTSLSSGSAASLDNMENLPMAISDHKYSSGLGIEQISKSIDYQESISQYGKFAILSRSTSLVDLNSESENVYTSFSRSGSCESCGNDTGFDLNSEPENDTGFGSSINTDQAMHDKALECSKSCMPDTIKLTALGQKAPISIKKAIHSKLHSHNLKKLTNGSDHSDSDFSESEALLDKPNYNSLGHF